MIIVIADDFTGAAELAGISLRYGLKVEMCNSQIYSTNADVLIICTNSRSLSNADAIKVTSKVIESALSLNPTLIYKKIDSVLRGYVIDELKTQMRLSNLSKALIIPANPSLGRKIKEGEYFIGDKKINNTDFKNDPEFPIKSSYVKEILNDEVVVLKIADELPSHKIIVGEATTTDDINIWANKISGDFILAGAGDFFTAILQKQFKKEKNDMPVFKSPFLYVCGSSFKKAKDTIAEIKQMANTIIAIDNYFILIKTRENNFVLAINDKAIDCTALQLRNAMAITTAKLIADIKIKELFVEGGSTSASILQELQVDKLYPINELNRGVVRMKANDLYITVKPGSYALPQEIKNIYFSHR